MMQAICIIKLVSRRIAVRLTAHTDYALRIMMQVALDPSHLLSIANVARDHAISRNHVMKVVSELAQAGYLETVRGRNGGIRLGRPAAAITVGEIVRLTEPTLRPANCAECVLQRGCGLTPILDDALNAFLKTLDDKTIADVVAATTTDRLQPGNREQAPLTPRQIARDPQDSAP